MADSIAEGRRVMVKIGLKRTRTDFPDPIPGAEPGEAMCELSRSE